MCIISTAALKGLLWVRVELPGDAQGDLSTHDGKGSGHEGRRIWSRWGGEGGGRMREATSLPPNLVVLNFTVTRRLAATPEGPIQVSSC